MIDVSNLTKRFGRHTAIDNLSFSVESNQIVGFLGPNGAGKTTTMRILAGYLPPTGGEVRIAGLDPRRHSLAVRQAIGYLPENMPLYQDMRVGEYLRYRGRLKSLYGRKLRQRLEAVLHSCELVEEQRTIIGRLSRGYCQRVGLADSLIHDPDVLILDEPTIGLDPNQIRNIRALIKNLARRHTVLLSSHILNEVEVLCDRVLILDKGRIVASDKTSDLIGLLHGNRRVHVELQGPLDEIGAELEKMPGVKQLSCRSADGWQFVSMEVTPGHDVRPLVFKLAAGREWPLRELKMESMKLEDVFAALTVHAEEAASTPRDRKEGQ